MLHRLTSRLHFENDVSDVKIWYEISSFFLCSFSRSNKVFRNVPKPRVISLRNSSDVFAFNFSRLFHTDFSRLFHTDFSHLFHTDFLHLYHTDFSRLIVSVLLLDFRGSRIPSNLKLDQWCIHNGDFNTKIPLVEIRLS